MNLTRYVEGFYKVIEGLITFTTPEHFNANVAKQIVEGAPIQNQSNVEVVDKDHPYFGSTGRVVRVLRGTPLQFRVVLDNHLTLTFDRDQLEVFIIAPVGIWR